MCGRYYYDDHTPGGVESALSLSKGAFSLALIDMMPSAKDAPSSVRDITPGMSPLVLATQKGSEDRSIRVTNMFWGITGKDKKLIINARAESAMEKPMFADSIEHRRCLMPAAGFYEWDKGKNKVTFFREDKGVIFLAGFYQLSENRDCFVILTTSANESMIKVHDRMPLMIEKASVKDWLYDRDAAKEILTMKMPQLRSSREYEQLSLF